MNPLPKSKVFNCSKYLRNAVLLFNIKLIKIEFHVLESQFFIKTIASIPLYHSTTLYYEEILSVSRNLIFNFHDSQLVIAVIL